MPNALVTMTERVTQHRLNKWQLSHTTTLQEIRKIKSCKERKELRMGHIYLNQEFITPAIKRLECLWYCHVEHKYTSISPTVESNTEALETLLSSCVPNLSKETSRQSEQVRQGFKQKRSLLRWVLDPISKITRARCSLKRRKVRERKKKSPKNKKKINHPR